MEPLPPTNAELLRQFNADRDPAAFTELVTRHYGMVTGIGRRILGDAHEAEDIAQTTFILPAEKTGIKSQILIRIPPPQRTEDEYSIWIAKSPR